MRTKSMWLMAAVAIAAGSVTVARAQNVLDDALNGKKDAPAPAKVEGAEGKEVQPTRPKVAEIGSPDAAKQLDNQDLDDKLLGKGNKGDGGGDPLEKMNTIMERMGQSETKLTKEQDPGVMTREIQSRIVIDLDSMIELLKKQQQQQQSQGQGDPKPGDEKKESQAEKSQGPGEPKGTEAAQDDNIRGGGSAPPGNNGEDWHDGRKGWGALPPKDRALVTTGAKEKFLPEYKDMIQRYYEALAELNKTSKDH